MTAETPETNVVRIAIGTISPDQDDAEAVPVVLEQAPAPRRWRRLDRFWPRRRSVGSRHRRG